MDGVRGLDRAWSTTLVPWGRVDVVTRRSLRDVLSGLWAAGLASAAAWPSTGRALPIALTAAGRSQLDRADGIVLDVDDRMTADLAPTTCAGSQRC